MKREPQVGEPDFGKSLEPPDHDGFVGEVGVVETRFLVEVPEPETRFSMGKGLEGSTYDGFGITAAKENGFLNAGGWLWAQSGEDMTLQSFGHMSSLAAEDNLVIAKKGARVVGGDGVFIGAGFGMSAAPKRADGIANPESTGTSAVGKTALVAGVTIGFVDAFIGVSLLAREFWHVDKWLDDPPESKIDKALTGVALTAAAATIGLGVMGAVHEAAESSPPVPGVTIFGQEGVIVASPLATSIYGGLGLLVGSLYPMVFGLEAEMYALRTATLSSNGEAAVEAKTKASLTSGGKVEIAAKGEVSIRAGWQMPIPMTCDVTITDESIEMVGPAVEKGVTSHNTFKMEKAGISLAHPKAVNATVGTTKATLGPLGFSLDTDGQANVLATKSALELKHPTKVSIKGGAASIDTSGGDIVMKADRILLG